MADPCLWGSSLWHYLNIISFTYPDNPGPDVITDMYNYMINLYLPCEECLVHYRQALKSINVSGNYLAACLSSRDLFSKWIYALHTNVNKRLNKPNMSYEEVYDKYSKLRNSECSEACDSDGELKCEVKLVPKYEKFTDGYNLDTKSIIIVILGFLLLCCCMYLIHKRDLKSRRSF